MSHRSSPSLPETRRATLPATPSWPMAAARSMRSDKETAMDGVERLLAIEEIKTLFARRLRYMDLGKWDRYGSCQPADAWSETYGELPLDKQPRSADGQSHRVVGHEALANQIMSKAGRAGKEGVSPCNKGGSP